MHRSTPAPTRHALAATFVTTLALALLAACSSSSSAGGTSAASTTTSTTTGTGGGSTTSTGAGGGDGGAGTGGGNAGGAGGGAGGGGASAASIYPIATGYTWTYAVTAIGAGDSCSASNGVTTVLGPVTLGGKAGFEEQNVCTPAGQKVTLAVEGDRVFVWNAGTSAWEVAIDAPVEEGHSWTVTVGTRTWHDAGTVTVPAGTFTDCWRADQVGDVTGSYTYCRGVGLVAETNQDAQGNGSDVKLTKKSF